MLHDFTHIWNLKKHTKWTNTVKQCHRYREQSGDCQRGEQGWGKTEIGEGD